MSTLLEERYRRALRLLPPVYRAAWADDMVDTFMERAYAAAPDDPEGVDISRPGRAELASIVWLAIRLRLGGTEAAQRPRLMGDAVRIAALVGLLYHAAMALAVVFFTVWLSTGRAGIDIPPELEPYPSRWHVLTGGLALLWVVAFMTVLFGQSRHVWMPAVAALVVDIAIIAVSGRGGPVSPTVVATVLVSLATVLAVLGFHPSAPPVRARPWLTALGIAAVGSTVSLAVRPTGDGYLLLVDWLTPYCVAFVVVTVVQLRRATAAHSAWPLALALIAVALLVIRGTSAAYLIDLASHSPAWPLEVAILATQLAAVFTAGLAAAVRARRIWRKLPPPTPDRLRTGRATG
jgi:hypothetical protein